MALNILDSKDVWPLIEELLFEIEPENYVGGRPPVKAYEKTIEGLDLFAFSWESEKLSGRIYIKYALKEGKYYYVSLHDDRPPSEIKKDGGKE